MKTPAEELHQAVFYIHNPMRRPAFLLLDDELHEPLTALLNTAAEYANTCDTPTLPAHVQRALDLARAINTPEN
ncbi:hypothetical protein ABZ619_39070 [Streptomyces sp. NPDC007851]|uniref:hypothetical protein n=1 Tax=Streptomyces sp. NPDC007851 TaxID=3155008 RepID=UPI0033C658C6